MSRSRTPAELGALLLVVACSVSAADLGKDEPADAQARAIAALPKAQVLAIRGQGLPLKISVRDLLGNGKPLVGAGGAVKGKVSAVDAALRDLGAKVSDTEIRIELAADVLFDFDKADLRAEADATLGKAATVLAAYPGAKVTISGHTDSKGDDAYNQALSERRAQSVTAWLRAHGGKTPATFVVRGAGEREPVAPNTRSDGSDDAAARQKNRRVEILVQTKR